MTTLKKIRNDHVRIVRQFLSYADLSYSENGYIENMIERVLTAKMMSLHHHWFSTSKRERYRLLERSVA